MFKNLFDRKFISTFVVVLIFNLLFVLFAVSYGYSGEFTINPEAVSGLFGNVFSGIWSLLTFLVVIFAIFAVLWIGYILWKNSSKVPLFIYIGMLVALAIFVFPTIHFEALSFNFVPVLIFLVASAIETIIIKRAFNRTSR